MSVHSKAVQCVKTLAFIAIIRSVRSLPVYGFKHPLTTAWVAASMQSAWNVLKPAWSMCLLVRLLRAQSRAWDKHVGATRWSWAALYTWMLWNCLLPRAQSRNYRPFMKLCGYFVEGTRREMKAVNGYNAGAEGATPSIACDPSLYHPTSTCPQHSAHCVKRVCVHSATFFIPAYASVWVLRAILSPRHRTNSSSLKAVLRSVTARTMYALWMALGNRTSPCAARAFGVTEWTVGASSFLVVYVGVFASLMFWFEQPSQRKAIFDFTLAQALVGVVQFYSKATDATLSTLFAGIAFGWMHRHAVRTASEPSSVLQKVARWMFVNAPEAQ